MKKTLFYLLILAFTVMFTACGSDDDDDNNGTMNTSFTVTNTNDGAEYKSAVAGYFENGKCKKIADLGDLKYNVPSAEIKVTNSKATEVFVFYLRDDNETYRISPGFKLENNKKSDFKIGDNIQISHAPKNDDIKYPH